MSDLDRVKYLAELLVKQTEAVKAAEESLKGLKAAMLATEREDLPMLMKELEFKEFRLENGYTISVVDEVDAAITAKTQQKALAWLVSNNFGGLIKTEVAVQFERGAHDEASKIYEELSEQFDGVMLVEKVHPATVKAFVKEQLNKGASIPMDLFNVRPYSKAKVSKGK